MNREEAWQLVTEWTQSESLIHHMLAVEAAMRAYAHHFGEDETRWGVVGLLHDFDYEKHPDMTAPGGHPFTGLQVLRDMGIDDDIIRAIAAHASERTGMQPESLMEKSLVAVDELTGFLTAVALVRPSRDIRDITKIKSVRNKWKDRSFAAAIHREEIEEAAAALGVDLWEEHIPRVLEAMKGIAADLALDGSRLQDEP
ncbi:MAG: HDIG domain-containing protein [Anaerolineae bacterium]|nr:HDIG domain-containing protein [Anaerolineae bacterium]